MIVKDETIHHRKVQVCFSETDLQEFLIKKAADLAGFPVDRNTASRVIIREKDRIGTVGFEYYAEVTLTNNL